MLGAITKFATERLSEEGLREKLQGLSKSTIDEAIEAYNGVFPHKRPGLASKVTLCENATLFDLGIMRIVVWEEATTPMTTLNPSGALLRWKKVTILV